MPSRIAVARWIWYLYGAAFPFLVFGALLVGTRALPLMAGVPLLGVVGLSAVFAWRRSPRFILIALAASVLQVILGVLLLGGTDTSVVTGNRVVAALPGLPTMLQVPALLLGLVLPPCLVFYSVGALRSHGATVAHTRSSPAAT
jgi:hypothetical protein